MSKAVVAISQLKSCARCGKNHRSLVFKKLTRPAGELTHWALCPNNHQPIMMKIVPPFRYKPFQRT